MLFVLLLLKLLPFLALFLLKLLLLLLVFLVQARIPRVGSSGVLHRRKVVGMNRRGGGGRGVTAGLSLRLGCAAIGRRIVGSSSFFRRNRIVASKLSRLGGRRDW